METTLIVILALANMWQIFAPSILSKRKEADNLDDKVVRLLKENIAALEKKVGELENEQKKNSKEIETLTASNKLLTAILQGRDEKTQKFQDEGFKAIQTITEIQQMLRSVLAMPLPVKS